jgi:tetratricopeptide (TPR) repeat protein
MAKNRCLWTIGLYLLAVTVILAMNVPTAVSEDAEKPEDIYAEAERLFGEQNYEQALPLYNKLTDKKYASVKLVSDKKAEIAARIKECEKKLGIITDITSLFNGKTKLTKKGKDKEHLALSYDFSAENQAEDFDSTSGINMTVKDGALRLKTKDAYGIPNILLKHVTFMNPMSIEFDMKPISDEVKEIFVGLFDDPDSISIYYYIFNCESRDVLTNLIAFPSGKQASSLSYLVGTEDCLGTFNKPKIEPNKNYKMKISIRDGTHQVSVDNNVVKEVKNDKHTFGRVRLGCSNATILIDNLKIEGMLEPESTRKTLTGLTSKKQAQGADEDSAEIEIGGESIRIRFNFTEEITPRNLMARIEKDRKEELLNKGLQPAQEAVTKGLETLKDMPSDATFDYDTYAEYLATGMDKFSEAIKYDPSYALAFFLRGRCYRLMNDLENSLKELNGAIGAAADFYEAYVDRAQLLTFSRKYKDAIKDMDKAIEVKPDYAEAWAQRGYAYFGMGDRVKAMADIDKALEIDKNNSSAKEYSKYLKNVVKGPSWQKMFNKDTKWFVFKTDISQAKCDLYAKNLELILKHILKTFLLKEDALLSNKAEALIFDSEDSYLTYAELSSEGGASGTLGYFHPIYRQLLLFEPPMKEKQTLRVMYHETFHMVIDRYLQDIPIWFNEGMAEYIGGTDIAAGLVSPGQIHKARLKNVMKAIEYENEGDKKYLIPFKQIMNESKARFYSEDTGLKYAQAWTMMHFFIHYNNGQYFGNLKSYLQTLMAGKTPKEAYDKAFGKVDLKQAEKEWRGYVQKMK